MFSLPPLPYKMDALEPHMSRETLQYHYGKHHKKYVDTLNRLVEGRPEERKSLEDLIRSSEGKVFNNAAQAWNHTFFWHCLSPEGGDEPKGSLAETMTRGFGSFDEFKKKFGDASEALFGSGWAWLIAEKDGAVNIVQTKDADNPVRTGQTPLLTVDLWEHAYYIDHRNSRPRYLDSFWRIVNWEFVEANLQGVAAPVGAR